MREHLVDILRRLDLLDRYFVHRRRVRRLISHARTKLAFARTERHIGGVPNGFRLVDDGGEPSLALCVPHVHSWELRDRNLVDVAEALARGGLHFFVVPTDSEQRTAVGVLSAVWEQAIDSLASSGDANTYVSTSRGRKVFQLTDRASWTRAARDSSTLDVYSVVSSASGDGVLGREYRCQLQRWDEAAGDAVRIVPPESVDDVEGMPRERAMAAESVVGDLRVPTAPEFSWQFSAKACPFPIDVVYTWVDGEDPDWLIRRESVATDAYEVAGDGDSIERFRALDELRYSLRSVWEHVPYARHIYVVTDGQVPGWLDTADPRITIVDHSTIFEDPSALPTFNSHAIETQLHHIDGLADQYLYLNDDVFFGRTSDWATYFGRSGSSHFFPSTARFPVGELDATDKSVDHAGRNLQVELFRQFGWAPRTKLLHTPHPQQRRLLIELEQRFADRYRATMHAKLRSFDDVSFAAALHHRYAQVTGRASVGGLAYEYLALESDNIADHFDRLSTASFDTLCLNDGQMTPQRRAEVRPLLLNFLHRRFPYPAPWEIDGGRTRQSSS